MSQSGHVVKSLAPSKLSRPLVDHDLVRKKGGVNTGSSFGDGDSRKNGLLQSLKCPSRKILGTMYKTQRGIM